MRIAILGYGKMGKEIEKIALERNHSITLKISSKNTSDFNTANLKNVDVAIDFTQPDVVINNIYQCIKTKTPIVVGTTGWYKQLDKIKMDCKKNNSTLLYATNCSIGVNVFFKLNDYLSKLMNKLDYKVKIEETHHTKKLDAPSGTAITLANDIIKNLDIKTKWINQESNKSEELSILSHRIENVPGTHTVNYSSEIDEINIEHIAHNRKGFALGAVIAAEYIYNKKGIFTMNDVLFNE